MRKYGGRGRGRGRGGPAGTDGGGGASAGSAKSTAAPKAGGVQPALSSGSRRSGRLPFLGVGKPLLKPEHQEQVLAYMAETASSSIASSSEISKLAGCTSGDSLELFSHTMSTLSSEILNSPVQDEDEMEFSDAQPLLYDSDSASTLNQSTALPSQCTEPDSDPDETQVPLPAHYTTLQCDTEEGADEIEEEAMDDPVVDPDWHPVGEEGAAAGTSEEEEDPQQASTSQVRVTGRPVAVQKGVTKAKRIAPQLGQTVNVAQRANPEKTFHTRKSAVWHFFDQDLTDETKVICKKCRRTFSRGKNLRSLNTSCMLRHVNSMHLQAWTEYQHSGAPAQTDGRKQGYIPSPTVSPPVSTPPARNLEVSLQGQSSQGISMFFHRKTSSGPSPPPPSPTPSQSAMSTASSTICTSEVQLTLAETLSRTRKYSASHPRTRALNAYIAKLISFEMMPFRLVESAAFRDLMAYAVPRYDLPSRYFFSRKAIPALHLHVKDRIVHALKQSVSGKVHLTTDAWTSRHGQGRYVSITAHWVNVVDAGDSMGGTVLPSPRSRQQLAVGVRPSSSFSSSTSSRRKTSSPDCSRTSTPSTTASLAHEVSHYRTASGKRQQALLRMMSLGDKRHTAEVLADYLQRETESWLGSLHLEPGKVVSDNGRNFVAAIALAKLTHVPCLAHTLNLVVQCFINHYPDLQPLLQKVRRLCSHIRRSPVDSSRLQRLQRSLHLPNHRLIIDVATRWNSTMHMVERLCEQRQAVMQLWEDTRAGSFRAHIELSGVQWSRLKDVCKVLQCFEECTRLVSADNAIISMTIPLVRLLMKTLTHIKDQASAAEEEEEADDEEEGSLVDSQAFGREGVLGHERQCSFHTQSSAQATVQDEVEEEEEEEDEGDESFGEEDASHGARETVGLSGSGAGFVRDCRDVDFAECAPPTATGSASLTPGTLAHMCDYLLRILKRDPRLSKIMKDDDYWLASILDPRYKDKLTNIMPQENVELILANKKTTLVDRLLEAFPAHSSAAGCTTSRTGPHGTGVRGAHSRTGVGDRGLMTMLWSDFSSPAPTTGNTASIATDRRQQMSTMVQNYLASPIDVLPHSSFPFDYWACKLDTWPELAQYALQELACPVGSVLSERVFSAAGSVLTEKRTRLSTQNVGDLTFIKMNHAWVSNDFVPPSTDDS